MRHRNYGFTLVELLVTVAVMGVLSTLAIAQYEVYRAKAFDLHALRAVQMLNLGQETYFVDNGHFSPLCQIGAAGSHTKCQDILPGVVELKSYVYANSVGIGGKDEHGPIFQVFANFSCSRKGSKLGERRIREENHETSFDSIRGYGFLSKTFDSLSLQYAENETITGRIFESFGVGEGAVVQSDGTVTNFSGRCAPVRS